MKTVILNSLAKLKLLGLSLHLANDSDFTMILAALIMTAILKLFVGTNTPQILQLAIRDVSINIPKILALTLDGVLQLGMPWMMLLSMESSAKLAGLGTQTEAQLLSALTFPR